jgi:hypothetical protein
MNLEAMSQISDSISFILVTPEFIREERLKWLRSLPLSGLWLWFFRNWWYTIPSLAFYIVFSVLAVRHLWLYPSDIGKLGFDDVISSVVITAFASVVVLATILKLLAYRGLLFFLGACLFFSTRALSIWHAMSAHAG